MFLATIHGLEYLDTISIARQRLQRINRLLLCRNELRRSIETINVPCIMVYAEQCMKWAAIYGEGLFAIEIESAFGMTDMLARLGNEDIDNIARTNEDKIQIDVGKKVEEIVIDNNNINHHLHGSIDVKIDDELRNTTSSVSSAFNSIEEETSTSLLLTPSILENVDKFTNSNSSIQSTMQMPWYVWSLLTKMYMIGDQYSQDGIEARIRFEAVVPDDQQQNTYKRLFKWVMRKVIPQIF